MQATAYLVLRARRSTYGRRSDETGLRPVDSVKVVRVTQHGTQPC